MFSEKIRPMVKGMIKHIPGVKQLIPKRTGGTIESRYCYAIWMRHLINLNAFSSKIPETVAELGPGDSIGIGLAALLSGCKRLYSLDVDVYWDAERNLKIFNELIELYKNKTTIPNNEEYPRIQPTLENHNFPAHIIADDILNESLSENRLEEIREEILNLNNPNNKYIKVFVPWYDSNIIDKNTVDFIYSQAVLQSIDDIENTYKSMNEWIKPRGFMSHSVDFKSLDITRTWNGHWTFSDFEWKIVKGGASYLINRLPYSEHVALHSKYGFKILSEIKTKLDNKLSQKDLASAFKDFSDEDLTTSSVFVVSQKE